MWLPLMRCAKSLPGVDSVPAGSLRVRVQWAAEDLLEAGSGEAVLPNLCLELALHKGIEVSIVEAGRLSLPREVLANLPPLSQCASKSLSIVC